MQLANMLSKYKSTLDLLETDERTIEAKFLPNIAEVSYTETFPEFDSNHLKQLFGLSYAYMQKLNKVRALETELKIYVNSLHNLIMSIALDDYDRRNQRVALTHTLLDAQQSIDTISNHRGFIIDLMLKLVNCTRHSLIFDQKIQEHFNNSPRSKQRFNHWFDKENIFSANNYSDLILKTCRVQLQTSQSFRNHFLANPSTSKRVENNKHPQITHYHSDEGSSKRLKTT